MSYALGQAAPAATTPSATPGTIRFESGATIDTGGLKTFALVAGGILLFVFLIKDTKFGAWAEEKSRGLEDRRRRRES